MLYFPQLLRTSVVDDLFNGIEGLTEILLLAQTLSLQDLSLNISIGLVAVPNDLVVVPPLYVLSLVKSIYGIIVVILSHEGLGKGDVHVDLKQLGLWQFFCQFLVFVERYGDMFDCLFDTVIGNIGLSKVVVGYNQPEVRFTVIQHKELI